MGDIMRYYSWIAGAVAMGGALVSMSAHAEEAKKAPLFTYAAQFAYPRAEWPNVKAQPKELALDRKLTNNGTIIGFGQEESLVHSENGYTHNWWWAAHSASALIDLMRDQTVPADPEMIKATKHGDALLVSEHYGYRAASIKNGVDFVSIIVLKSGAPKDAQDALIRQFYEPVMEKLLADGVVVEYDASNEYVSTSSDMPLYLNYIAKSTDSIDKVEAALNAAWDASPNHQTWASYIDWSKERDIISSENAELK